MTINQTISRRRPARIVMLLVAWTLALAFSLPLMAYPPGPYHLLYGTIRDQYGVPLSSAQARVVLETLSGAQFSAPILPDSSLPGGGNYVLKVPLDSGITPDLYQPNVMVPAAPFKLGVVIGTVFNVPIEMTNYAVLGRWAENTRLDLTLGTDLNGDGLPDAWEIWYLTSVGVSLPLSAVNGNTIVPPSGLTLGQEYLFATTGVPPGVAPSLTFVGFHGASPILQFSIYIGRSYRVFGSSDLRNWAPVTFNLPTDPQGTPARTFYIAPGSEGIQVYLAPPPAGVSDQFYRVVVQ